MKEVGTLILSLLILVIVIQVVPTRSRGVIVPAYAQSPTTPPQNPALSDIDDIEVFKKLTSGIRKLKNEIESSSGSANRLKGLNESGQIQFKQLVDRSDVDARKLVALVGGRGIPQLYAQDLLDNSDLMEQVRLSKRIGKLELRKVEFVSSDLQVKVADASLQTAPQKARTIPIIITTYKGNTPSGIFEVIWVTKRGFDLKNKTPETFPKPSDEKTGETSKGLPPGIYKMWTRSMTDQKHEGAKKDITVGGGQSECRDYLIAKD